MSTPSTVKGVFYNPKETRSFASGAVIFEQGDDGAEMFGIVDGAVELRAREGFVRKLGPQEVFGELALVDSSPRSATAVATADTTLAVIDRHRFLFLYRRRRPSRSTSWL